MTQTLTTDGQSRPEDQRADHVRADHVEMTQAGANSIEATTVTITQGGAGMVRATDVSVSEGGIGLARADRISMRAGSSVAAAVANEATFESGSNAMLLIAGRVGGEVRPLLDWRAAAAFGAALGIALAVLRRR